MDFELEVEIDSALFSVRGEVDNIKTESNGIGDYEFWGAKCHDSGVETISSFDINIFYVDDIDESCIGNSLKEKIKDILIDDGRLDELIYRYLDAKSDEREEYFRGDL